MLSDAPTDALTDALSDAATKVARKTAVHLAQGSNFGGETAANNFLPKH